MKVLAKYLTIIAAMPVIRYLLRDINTTALIPLKEERGSVWYILIGHLSPFTTEIYKPLAKAAEGTVVLVHYRKWRPEVAARKIKEDLARRGKRHAKVISLCVGDIVARYLDSETFTVYAVTPCLGRDFQQSATQCVHQKFYIIELVALILLGPLADLPLIRINRSNHRLSKLFGQISELVRPAQDYSLDNVAATVVAVRDEYLDNTRIDTYPNKVWIEATHLNLLKNAEAYVDGLVESGAYEREERMEDVVGDLVSTDRGGDDLSNNDVARGAAD